MALEKLRDPNPNLRLIITFLKELTKKHPMWFPILTFIWGSLFSFALALLNQQLTSQREIMNKRKELTAKIYGHIPYVLQCWGSFYDLRIDQAYKLDFYRIYHDTLAFYQWRELAAEENELVFKTAEARKTLIELLENIKIYFSNNHYVNEIIDKCDWFPVFNFSSYLALTDSQRLRFKNIKEWYSAIRDSSGTYIIDYFKPLGELSIILETEAEIHIHK